MGTLALALLLLAEYDIADRLAASGRPPHVTELIAADTALTGNVATSTAVSATVATTHPDSASDRTGRIRTRITA